MINEFIPYLKANWLLIFCKIYGLYIVIYFIYTKVIAGLLDKLFYHKEIKELKMELNDIDFLEKIKELDSILYDIENIKERIR